MSHRTMIAVWVACSSFCSSEAGAQSLSSPESLQFDSANQRYLISNRGAGNILARSTEGTLTVFTDDPSSPAGMEIMQGAVYVADGARVRGYRLSDAVRVLDFPIPGAGFLNGLASNGNGILWVTDFSQRRLHALDVSNLSAPVLNTLLTDTVFTPNGVVWDGAENRLLLVSWGANARIAEYRFADQMLNTIVTTTLGNFDGIVLGCDNAVYVSSWSPSGTIRRLASPLTVASPALDFVMGLSNPADIAFSPERSEIASPNAGNNSVSFHPIVCPTEPLFANGFE